MASALNDAFADANWDSDTGLLPQMVVIALVDATFLVGNEVIEVFIFPMLSIAWGRITKYSQDGLDEAYSPPQFKLADKYACRVDRTSRVTPSLMSHIPHILRYAYIIKHVAICLTFGSACPLLYCICFVALAMMYVCQKAALVMYYARPSVTEDSLAEAFRDQLTILLFMHVAFSFVFYAKQEFDVYGIGADRYSAFALGAAPFGVALLAAPRRTARRHRRVVLPTREQHVDGHAELVALRRRDAERAVGVAVRQDLGERDDARAGEQK